MNTINSEHVITRREIFRCIMIVCLSLSACCYFIFLRIPIKELSKLNHDIFLINHSNKKLENTLSTPYQPETNNSENINETISFTAESDPIYAALRPLQNIFLFNHIKLTKIQLLKNISLDTHSELSMKFISKINLNQLKKLIKILGQDKKIIIIKKIKKLPENQIELTIDFYYFLIEKKLVERYNTPINQIKLIGTNTVAQNAIILFPNENTLVIYSGQNIPSTTYKLNTVNTDHIILQDTLSKKIIKYPLNFPRSLS